MPYQEADSSDPMTLQGVVFDSDDDWAVREMAECFVDEFVRLGFDADRLLRLFRTPGYAGPYLAYRALGDEAIRGMIVEKLALRGSAALKEPGADVDIALPVLDPGEYSEPPGE